MEKITEYLIKSTVSESEVKAWEEIVMLPTYGIGKEEKNPLFLEKRVYQGSSGSVYPYPVVEKIKDEKKDKPYKALFIENEFIKVMILPELGGRIQMAYDKVKGRHFVYYNQVVKPALVGLTGPWISGGIEFNWPQHHRPSTFLPTEYTIEEFPDGSKTIWCSEVERMFRTKGMMGFTLYPGKAYIEVKAKIYNRTPFPQTFLWWANPAVVVHDDYFSVFPPDVNAVFDHGKRDVSTFPIATGTYYKVDYSKGVDISRYKNIPVPTSYMAVNSKYDFVGGYEEHIDAGMLHVANHHVNAGKKQWTWGHGDFGQAWDRNLTDEDGPYIELMTGMYCDNQPDFSWLQPYEEKTWKQYFMPYQNVGMVKNATKDAMLNITKDKEGQFKVVVYATGVYEDARIILKDRVSGKIIMDRTANISPLQSFIATVAGHDTDQNDVELTVYSSKQRLLVKYSAVEKEEKPIPEPAKAAKAPKDVENNEQLFLTGHHLEQYRHAPYFPADYYMEALRRDPGDIRCNNAMGLLLMRKGEFAKAEEHLRKAIETQTERNPNPYDGEPHYNLGLCCRFEGKNDEAYDAFYKATWNSAWQDAGYMSLAQIDMARGDLDLALDHIDRSLYRNWTNLKGRHLKAAILRKSDRAQEARTLIEESLKFDRFNVGCLYELYLIAESDLEKAETLAILKSRLRDSVHNYLEYSIDYATAGMYQEATDLLSLMEPDPATAYPMAFYALGWIASLSGDGDEAKRMFILAEQCPPDYCFPNKIEEVLMLEKAMELNPEGSKAPYYLGNFLYNARMYDRAIGYWERSAALDDQFPTVLRNLSLAYYNKLNDPQKAVDMLEKAFALDCSDSRILMELDQLYKKLRKPHSERLAFLETHLDAAVQRDDVYVEMVTLHNQLGDFAGAAELIKTRKFHPWEGGEGKITNQFLISRLELAKIAIGEGRYEEAITLLNDTVKYPDNLGEGKLAGAEENDIHYYMGCAYEGTGNQEKADEYFKKATTGSKEPAIAFFYNDQQPDKIFYQGLALEKLGRNDEAKQRFESLIAHGQEHIDDEVKISYFAVSLPELLIWDEDLKVRNLIHCNLVMGMGYLGLGEKAVAAEYFDKVLDLDINHQGAAALRKLC